MEEYINEDINLLVGQSKKIKIGFFNSFNIVYCGMPNKDVFSLSLMLSSGYQGYGFNLYYQIVNFNLIIIFLVEITKTLALYAMKDQALTR